MESDESSVVVRQFRPMTQLVPGNAVDVECLGKEKTETEYACPGDSCLDLCGKQDSVFSERKAFIGGHGDVSGDFVGLKLEDRVGIRVTKGLANGCTGELLAAEGEENGVKVPSVTWIRPEAGRSNPG